MCLTWIARGHYNFISFWIHVAASYDSAKKSMGAIVWQILSCYCVFVLDKWLWTWELNPKKADSMLLFASSSVKLEVSRQSVNCFSHLTYGSCWVTACFYSNNNNKGFTLFTSFVVLWCSTCFYLFHVVQHSRKTETRCLTSHNSDLNRLLSTTKTLYDKKIFERLHFYRILTVWYRKLYTRRYWGNPSKGSLATCPLSSCKLCVVSTQQIWNLSNLVCTLCSRAIKNWSNKVQLARSRISGAWTQRVAFDIICEHLGFKHSATDSKGHCTLTFTLTHSM